MPELGKKIVCAACTAIVDFVAYDMTPPNSPPLEGVVAVDNRGGYLCMGCMNALREENPGSPGFRFIPVLQYHAITRIQRMSGILMMADDLFMQLRNTTDDMDGPGPDFYMAVKDWLDDYKKFKDSTTPKVQTNVH